MSLPQSKTQYLTVPATAKSKSLKTYTKEEVAQHSKEGDLWCIIDSAVYFVDLHPGGTAVLLDELVAGKVNQSPPPQDATDAFFGMHRSEVLVKYGRFIIGTIEGAKPRYILPTPGVLSPVPYAEPTWLTEGFKSPYYNDGHRALQKYMREFNDEYVRAEAQAHEKSNERPTVELIQKMGAEGVYINHMRLGPGKLLHGLTLPGGVKGEDFDYFHEQIVTQELVRTGARGYADGLQGGMVIGLPPVMNYGSPALKKEIIPEVLAGRKFISLAISEAFAGSDVAGLRCMAKKSADGKHYIVNGTKKWITNGNFSDYFSTGVNTGNGLSMLLIRRGEGVDTKLIKTSYSTAAGTAYITFDNVKVPVENLMGKEGKGIYVILTNFNHERWVMCCGSVAGSRLIVEECFKWAHQRNVFHKPLIEQAVIREKFAHMFAKIESLQAYLENITYQMNHLTYAQQGDLLGGPIGALKMWCTKMAGEISSEAVQIFGGRGITQGGMGGMIGEWTFSVRPGGLRGSFLLRLAHLSPEQFQRTQKFDAILGGAEEILGDLAVRQASRKMPRAVL
ncbi:BZ3500_MvSof-1268-A1-R1_Chr3-1g05828 [Microbotryum saponariae]|uniref:BZ3500_MvSof-1268-A1-R1_Chr3-1g05828 protein n=1 Tax=Microbotryum saponariae TaxID=289078 RepID=A0A2X0KY90_9BASI|nr:BZ3500_MvSof-1268-A1-R1_Chr3-1g05828 [Microbotryum saponariae]SDA05018.1 BZ3501_MvSof-1269-A2-R1_Chr3-1g05498 [Microbotryum saponariae]